MANFGNWQVTVVTCTTLLTVVLGQSASGAAINYLNLVSGPVDQIFADYSGETNVTFNCSVDGNPKPEVVWMRNDSRVIESTKYQVTSDGALVINNPVRSDHGDLFWCKVQNAAGSLRSQTATLGIAYVGPVSNANLPQVTNLANKGRCLPCNPPDAYPGIQVQWIKVVSATDQRPIQPSRRAMVLTDGQLCFAHVMYADAGTYECRVANSYDIGQPINFERSVSIPLRITQSGRNQPLFKVDVPTNITVRQGEEAVLECVFLSKPFAILQWARADGQALPDGASSLNGYQLTIPNAKANDSGEYICTATFGSSSQIVTQYLTVNSPPNITTELEDIAVNRGSSVSFRCESGNPSDEYSWYYNAEPITFTKRVQRKAPNIVQIRTAAIGDAGIYQCSVSNMFGTVFSTAQLRVNGGNRGNQPANTQPGGRAVPDANVAVTMTSSTVLLIVGMVYQIFF